MRLILIRWISWKAKNSYGAKNQEVLFISLILRKIASTTKDGKQINVIPDAIQDGVIYEVKDTKAVYNTSQIQGEYRAAKKPDMILK